MKKEFSGRSFLVLITFALFSTQAFAWDASKTRVAVIWSKYNEAYTKLLLEGAQRQFFSLGVPTRNINIIEAPGSFEIPLLTQKAIRSGKYDAVVCLGLILLNSQTRDMSRTIMDSIQRLSIESIIPVTNGIVTVERLDEANEAFQTGPTNRGTGAATAVLKTLESLEKL